MHPLFRARLTGQSSSCFFPERSDPSGEMEISVSTRSALNQKSRTNPYGGRRRDEVRLLRTYTLNKCMYLSFLVHVRFSDVKHNYIIMSVRKVALSFKMRCSPVFCFREGKLDSRIWKTLSDKVNEFFQSKH